MKFLYAFALTCIFSMPAFAGSPWDGTWNLDPARSQGRRLVTTYIQLPNGTLRQSVCDRNVDFRLDGKEYPFGETGHTLSSMMSGTNVLVTVERSPNGNVYVTTEEISADGKTITARTTSTSTRESKDEPSVETFTRISGIAGFVGKWRDNHEDNVSRSSYVITLANDGVMKWGSTQIGSVVGKTNGTELHGTNDSIAIIRKTGVRSFAYQFKEKGNILFEGDLVLSPDGQWITDSFHSPKCPDVLMVGVYKKQ